MTKKKTEYRYDKQKGESIKIWQLNNQILKDVYVNSIIDNSEGLTIELDNSKFNIIIKFNRSICYRNTNESYLLDKWNVYDKEKLKVSSFFFVENSAYISWLMKSNLNINKDLEIIHFAIFTPDDCIEILDTEMPIVTLKNLIDGD